MTIQKSMQKLKRSRNSFEDLKLKLQSDATKERAKYVLNNFEKFSQKYYQKSLDGLIDEIDSDEVAYDILQAWINYLDDKSPRTIINYFSVIRQFFHYRGIKFHEMDIKQNLNFPKIHEIERYGVTRDDIKLILDFASFKKKALYLCQLSSGLRIGELVRLRKKHLDLTKERIMVRLPAEFDKLRRERITFFSKEAERKLRPILTKLNDDDLIFGTNDKWQTAKNSELAYLAKQIDKMSDERYATGIRKITTHSFRAFFITKVSRLDPNLAKRFSGQKGYLMEYDRLSEDEKLEKYLEFENELLINERSDITNEKELEKDKRISELELKMENISKHLEHLVRLKKED